MINHDKNYTPERYTIKNLKYVQSVSLKYSSTNSSNKRVFSASIISTNGLFFLETKWSGRSDGLIGIHSICSPFMALRGLNFGRQNKSFAEGTISASEPTYTTTNVSISFDVIENTCSVIEDGGTLIYALLSGIVFTSYN